MNLTFTIFFNINTKNILHVWFPPQLWFRANISLDNSQNHINQSEHSGIRRVSYEGSIIVDTAIKRSVMTTLFEIQTDKTLE